MTARLERGGIVDDLVCADGRVLSVRYERCPAGWQAAFRLRHPAVDDLTVMHRLVAGTLGEARAAVPQAVAYLLGSPVDQPVDRPLD